MIRQSIVFKLWAAMTGLVLVVFGLIAVIQSQALSKTYYSQQSAQLLALGKEIAATAAAGSTDFTAATRNMMMSNILMGTLVYVVDVRGRSYAPGMWSMMGQPPPPPIPPQEMDRLKAGADVTAKGWNPYFRQNMFSVDVPIRSDGRFTGAVIIREPLEPLYANALALQRNVLLAGLAGLLLATFLSLLVSRSLARPLKQMIEAARAMAKGDYSRRVRTGAADEVGTLAVSLNTLAAELEDKVRDLERLNQTRRDFMANVSHELRTPLSVIQGFTEAIADGLARNEDTRQRYLQNILDEVERLRRLTADLLDLRRLEQGGWQLEGTSTVDVPALLTGVREKLSPLAAEKGVTVKTPPAGPAAVAGNQDRLQQVFLNLVGNAIQATPSGGQVTLTAGEKDGWVEVTVTDTGPGIKPEDLPLIWERFYKGDRSRSRGGAGTGLGLAIVRAIVEAHGGRVAAESQPGHGATFLVSLPAAGKGTGRQPRHGRRPVPPPAAP